MTEKTGHISTCRPRGTKHLCRALLLCLALGLSACLPSGAEKVNTDLFKDKDELKTKTSYLMPGMPKDKVFETLGISPEKFDKMSLEQVQTSVYGNSQVSGSPEQLERFRNRLMAYEGYALPYRNIDKDSSLGFGKMKMTKEGSDLRLILVFEQNRLLRAAVEGTEQVNSQEDQYLWGTLLNKSIGMAF